MERPEASSLPPKPVRESHVEMTELVLPNDANALGTVLGGKVMHLIDICGAMAAARHCRKPVVTASVDTLDFKHPIFVGQAMLLRGWVNYAARTSMEVQVEVYSEDLRTGERRHTSTALLTFVALDERRQPTPVPPVLPETEEEWRRYREAEARRAERLRRVRGAPPDLPWPEALPGPVREVLAGLEERQRQAQERRREGEAVTPLWCLPREAALLLFLLARATGARRVVEVGTSAGYSGTWLAAALPPDGRLYTVERDPDKVSAAREAFRRAGVAERVEILEGHALQVLPGLARRGPFDLVFLDAAKDEYAAYFDLLAPALRPGGLVVADNVVSHRAELAGYVEHVRRRPGFVSVTVPLGNGLEITCRLQ